MNHGRLTSDPFYRALLADIADTEWQIVEHDFLDPLVRGKMPEPWLNDSH